MADRTFAELWTAAGLDADAPPRQTLRSPGGTARSRATLPTLSLGEPGPGEPLDHDLTLGAVLGEGGMGVVWSAFQSSLGREVAVKRPRPDAPDGAERALLREGRTMGSLEHPNILPVHALGLDADGAPVLVMKRALGVTWATLLREPDHPWFRGQDGDRLEQHLRVLIAVCRALAFAHAAGVLHRDVKPDNVLVGAFGEVWLTDWGVARGPDDGPRRHVVGTPAYLAPELLDLSRPLDARVDVYLLGGCLHELLTGRPPHPGETLQEVLRSASSSPPPPLPDDLPPRLAELTRRALALDPADRPADADSFRRELEGFLRHHQNRGLVEAARRRLLELPTSTADQERLFTECRFAFQQALQADPGDQDARAGLVATLRHGVPRHLRSGDLEGTAALLDELDALGADTASDRADLATALGRREELSRLAHDHDAGLSAGARTLGLVGTSFAFFAITGAVLARRDQYGHGTAWLALTTAHGTIWAVLFLGRRRFLANAVNRAVVGLLVGTGVAGIAHRSLAWWFDVPLPAMLATDLVLMAGGVGAMIPHLGRRYWAPVVVWALGVPAIAALPEHHLWLFAAVGLAGLVAAILASAAGWARPRR